MNVKLIQPGKLQTAREWIFIAVALLFPLLPIATPWICSCLFEDGFRYYRRHLLGEDEAIEMITFALFSLAAVYGIKLSLRLRLAKFSKWICGFYLVFSIGLLFIAFEEIAWGQHLFHFRPPRFMIEANKQGELTLHNLSWMHRKTEVLRIAFGLGGLLGIVLGSIKRFSKVKPLSILAPWCVFIIATGTFDLIDDFVELNLKIHQTFGSKVFSRISELDELSIGLCALWYLLGQGYRLNRSNHQPRP